MINPLNFLIGRHPIAGLEISEDVVRLALLELSDGKTPVISVKTLAEEKLADGIVARGAVEDETALSQAIARLAATSGIGADYVVVSIPEEKIYSHVFSFPETIGGKKLEQTMELTIGFHLPVHPKDVYLDWEGLETPGDKTKEIYLAAAPRAVIDGFLGAIGKAGLKTVAVETHAASFARVAEIDEEPTLIIKNEPKSANFYILKNRIPHFTRIVPLDLGKAILKKEPERLKNFYEFENGALAGVINYGKLTTLRTILPEKTEDEQKWLISLGAAARGLLPRSEDNLVSIMPLGTEKAYEYQKASAFSNLAANIVIGVSIFFATAYLGSWLLMTSLQQNTTSALESATAIRISPESATLEERARAFNSQVANAAAIATQIPRWSVVMTILEKYLGNENITISNISMPSPVSAFNITGVALNREALNNFKRQLENAEELTNVTLPLSGVGLRANIPFSVSLYLKNPQMLYQY